MTLPQTRYTSLGEADIAYQVLGEGPLDLVYANGLTEHIDLQWDHPLMARFLERLASFSRLIMFDHIGARVAGAAQPGEVLVSRTVADLVAGSGIPFRDRGVHQLKGVHGSWQLYAVDK
jgi:hypothetical protein